MTIPVTYEVVIYDDGTSAVSLFTRDDTGHLTYIDRKAYDQTETMIIAAVLDKPHAGIPE